MSHRDLLHAKLGSLAFSAVFYALAWLLLRHGAVFSSRLAVFPHWPVLFDFLLTAPAFSWWLHRHDRKKAWRSALSVAALGLWVARYLMPGLSSELTRELFGLCKLMFLCAGAAELFLIVQMFRCAGRAARGVNPEYALQHWIGLRFGSLAIGRVIGFEARMWLYALMPRQSAWRYRGDQHFSYHLKDGYAATLQGYLVLLVIGLPAQHLLLQLFSQPLAWVTDALTLYGLLFLWAHYRACQHCPVSLDGQNLYLRQGLNVREQVIPLQSIVGVEHFRESVSRRVPGSLILSGGGYPNVRIYLRQHMPIEGRYGLTQSVDTIYLGLDQVPSFLSALDALRTDRRFPFPRD